MAQHLEVVSPGEAPPVWAALRSEALQVAKTEPSLASLMNAVILRHDTIGRECYQPGIVLAVREVMQRTGLVEGLDTLIGLT